MNIKGGDVRQTSPTLRDGLHAQGWAGVSSAPTFMTDPKETRVGRSDPPFLLLLRSAQVRVQATTTGPHETAKDSCHVLTLTYAER
jgi:hypothetical protein